MTLPTSGPLAMTDIQTEFGGTNPIGMNEYYAGGGLVPAGTSGTYGAVPSSGALSVQNFYGTSNYIPVYIEELFSTYLYIGNGSTQTINNGIDLAGEGGLVWVACRSNAQGNYMTDTVRGATKQIAPFSTAAQNTESTGLTAFSSTGFTVGSKADWNFSNYTYVSWTFRKAPKFFDVVTYTGNGVAGRQIAHNLGSVPGCIIVKCTSDIQDWPVYHRGISDPAIYLNQTTANNAGDSKYIWGDNTTSIAPTSTVFTVGGASAGDLVNGSGKTYVAYLFAHDAGGFGLSGEENVISCGSFVSGSPGSVTLGYEPQWLLIKRADDSTYGGWYLVDAMRGLTGSGSGNSAFLYAHAADAEYTASINVHATATGFTESLFTGGTYIYIAIRRGPMKVPESGTEVFSPNQTSATTGTQITTGFPVDWQLIGINAGNVYNQRSSTRLTGVSTNGSSNSQYLVTSNTNAEAATGSLTLNWGSTGFQVPSLNSGSPTIFWNFARAPGFFDVVCYTGTGVARTVAHNLTVAPELMIVKSRSAAVIWTVYSATLGNTSALRLNTADSTAIGTAVWNSTTPTIAVFSVDGINNTSAQNFAAYLFASCPGVSKVGSYTGNGSSQTINCGFTAGARFVLIKRTDSTGDWYVWDSARGIVADNDPYLLLNSTAAEVTSTDYIDPVSSGFEISSTAPAAINASGGTFIFLAIA